MGDHRISVEITVVGIDGKKEKIDWWLNWTDDMPSRIFERVVELANKAGLPVDPFHK